MCILMKSSQIIFFIFILGMSRMISAETPVRKCAYDVPLPLSVQVDSCSTMPCDLWKGSESQIIIQFVANRNDMFNVMANVEFTTLGVQIPYELEASRSDVCENLLYGAYCPLYKDEDVTYLLALPIDRHQPEVPTKVEISLLDSQNSNMISCFVLDAKFRSR
ncbi:uncharacterized protein LOC106082202 [Stomoxys calcitrans]|uniref:uncharacterized protein LOC106082202 n=1 Tax=Stomoxys calcitrans TaxID=35570 RepID=UPI0027E33881|nr:uncharacterized protein LOC106082202 [Stomoxys calcitrans]